MIKSKETLVGNLNVAMVKITPELEDITIIPTKQPQVFNHDNSDGYDNVTVNPIPDEYIIPEGTLPITENITYDVTNYARVTASVHPAPTLQNKEVTPTKDTQTITSDDGYEGLNEVKVNPIPNNYVEPSGTLTITNNGTYDVKQYESVQTNIEGAKPYAPRYIKFEYYSGTELTEELANLDTSKLESTTNMFRFCSNLKSVDLSNKDFSNVTDMSYMCNFCSSLLELDLSTLNLTKANSYQEFCKSASKLTRVVLPSALRFSVNLKQAFESCSALTYVDLSGVTKCSSWYRTFYSCSSLQHIDIRNLTEVVSSMDIHTFNSVPAGCEVIVKDDTIKSAILAIRSDFVVKTVAEL